MGFEKMVFGPAAALPIGVISVLLIWSLVWKGLGLWKSARNTQKWWFVAILLLNTAGILPILYMAFFQKKGKKR